MFGEYSSDQLCRELTTVFRSDFWCTVQVFDQGHEIGFCMHILDIGGGFAGGSFDSTGTVQLGRVPLAVNTALDTFFPDPSVKVSRHFGRLIPIPCALFNAKAVCNIPKLHVPVTAAVNELLGRAQRCHKGSCVVTEL